MSDPTKFYPNGINADTGTYGLEPVTNEQFLQAFRTIKGGGRLPEADVTYLDMKNRQVQIRQLYQELGRLEARWELTGDAAEKAELEAKIEKIKADLVKIEEAGVVAHIDPTQLHEAGWGIILAQDDPQAPAIQEALRELLDWRRPQAGEHFKIFAGEDGYRAGDTYISFINRHGAAPGPVDPKMGVPYYLLLAGSPVYIPYRFQYQLDVQYAVGRIYFDTPAEYAQYARQVVVTERDEVKLARKATFFGVANPHDPATANSTSHLIEPLYQTLKEKNLGWDFDLVTRDEATKARLSRLLSGEETPAFLFTASHGVEFSNGHPQQAPHQGALLCQDWAGPEGRQGPLTQDLYFAGDDLTGETNLSGLMTFHFACYGAGTPQFDEFAGLKRQRKEIAPQPFLANLPKQLLSHGALASVGHVERAWGHSFFWPGAGRQLAVFESTLEKLLTGAPVGLAVEYFNERYAELATLVNEDLREINFLPNPIHVPGQWTACADARNYIIVGDPAARLPTGEVGEPPAGRPAITVASPPTPEIATTDAVTTETTAPVSETTKASTMPETLYFNGINAETGQYGLALTPDALTQLVSGEQDPIFLNELKNKTQHASPLRADLDDRELSQAGWGVIFHAGAGPALQEALSDLLDWRQAQAGYYFKVFAGPDGYRPGETKNDFLSRHGVAMDIVDPDKGIPYYLLLVGSPQEIPFEFQYQLDVQFAVGRLHFESRQEYTNYARSVVTAEKEGVALPRRSTFFGVVNTHDRATQLSDRYLITPLVKTVAAENDKLVEAGLGWEIETFSREAATKARLQTILNGDQAPALLFTTSHGMEFPTGHKDQVAYQGALLCGDWPGPRAHRGPINRDWYFAGADISPDTNLLGLISFNFACYGAGTPHLDAFTDPNWPTRRTLAPQPFIANLPQKMMGLAKGGALAVVGHVERAWGYSFTWPGMSNNIIAFEEAMRLLMKGWPIGRALEAFDLRYATLATELTMLIDRREEDQAKLAGAWTAHNDARNFVVLGDPAVKLPIAKKDEAPQARPVVAVAEKKSSALSQGPEETSPKQDKQDAPPVEASASLDPRDPHDPNMAYRLFGGGKEDEVEAADALPGPLQTFLERLGNFMTTVVDDATTLTVETYVSHDLNNLTYEHGQYTNAAKRAVTEIKADGDIKLLIPADETGEIDTELWAIHSEAVKQAQADRAELVKIAIQAGANLLKVWKPD